VALLAVWLGISRLLVRALPRLRPGRLDAAGADGAPGAARRASP
jgi:hypothetical protein